MSSVILYQFDVYQGSSKQKSKERSQHGVAGDVVLDMTSRLEEGKDYKIYADNFFTSLSLVKTVKEKSLLCAGTVRSNQLQGCQMKYEKQLKHEGRGSCDSKVEMNSN